MKKELDATGLKCPMPIIKIAKEFKGMEIGDLLAVRANDPVFKADVEAWCKKTGNEFLSFKEEDDYAAITGLYNVFTISK